MKPIVLKGVIDVDSFVSSKASKATMTCVGSRASIPTTVQNSSQTIDVYISNATSGSRVAGTFMRHRGEVNSVMISPDGHSIASKQ